jgi:hypothetical protein
MDITVTRARTPVRRRLLTVSGAAGAAYVLSWIAGLAVPAPSPKFTASGAEIAAAVSGHQAAMAVQFALTEGLPAIGLAVVAIALARAARAAGATAAARLAAIAGLAASVISLTQFALGLALVRASASGTAHLLFDSLNRLDGVKMLTLAVLALAGATSGVLPWWLRWAAVPLAVVIAASGVVFLLLVQSLAVLAAPALVLLLVFIACTGAALGRAGR